MIGTEMLLKFELNHSSIQSHHEFLSASEWEMDLGFCSILLHIGLHFPLDGGSENTLWETMISYTPIWCYLFPQQIFTWFWAILCVILDSMFKTHITVIAPESFNLLPAQEFEFQTKTSLPGNYVVPFPTESSQNIVTLLWFFWINTKPCTG